LRTKIHCDRIKRERDAVAAQQLRSSERKPVADSEGKNWAARIFPVHVLHASAVSRGAAFEQSWGSHRVGPVRLRGPIADGADDGRECGASGETQTGLPQETAQGLAAEGEALDLAKFFAEVVIVEAA